MFFWDANIVGMSPNQNDTIPLLILLKTKIFLKVTCMNGIYQDSFIFKTTFYLS